MNWRSTDIVTEAESEAVADETNNEFSETHVHLQQPVQPKAPRVVVASSQSQPPIPHDELCKHPSGCEKSGERYTKGLCKRHGGQWRCTHESVCLKGAIFKGLCRRHGGKGTALDALVPTEDKCKHPSGCETNTKFCTKGLCQKHGGGWRCNHESDCKKQAVFKEKCKTHRERGRCTHESDCTRLVQSRGRCFEHGLNPEIRAPGKKQPLKRKARVVSRSRRKRAASRDMSVDSIDTAVEADSHMEVDELINATLQFIQTGLPIPRPRRHYKKRTRPESSSGVSSNDVGPSITPAVGVRSRKRVATTAPRNARNSINLNRRESAPVGLSGVSFQTPVAQGDRCQHPSGCLKSAKACTKDVCYAHGGQKRCMHESDCHKQARAKGLCKAHGGGARCKENGCEKLAQFKGLCTAHGGVVRCSQSGCEKHVQLNGLCSAHGGVRKCSQSGCEKNASGKGVLCISHGGVKRCKESGCSKVVLTKGLCLEHGGGKMCSANECKRRVKTKGLCVVHGGAKTCTHESGCTRPEGTGGIQMCYEHGGGVKCKHAGGCNKRAVARMQRFCPEHGKMKERECAKNCSEYQV